jgi:probable HAF family extracellular repeat protein
MTRSTQLCAFALLIGTLATNGACAAGSLPEVALYHVVDLGTYFYPKDLNNRGEVAGQPLDKHNDHAGFVLRGERWRPLPEYHPVVEPRAINDRGDVAGDGSGIVGFWPRGAGFMPVPLPPDATGGGEVSDISGHQVIVGNFFIGFVRGACFRWSAAEGSIDLGLMGNGDFCNVSAINDAGQIVGRATVEPGSGETHAFLWENGVFQDLNPAGVEGAFSADDINRQGHIVGGNFLWKDGKMIDLSVGTPYNGIIAIGINDRDEILGQAYDAEGVHTVLIAGNHIIELETAVDALHDWQFTYPRYINNLGEIVGWGFRTGDQRPHTFMLVPIP